MNTTSTTPALARSMRSTRYTLARQLANDTRGTHNAWQVMDRILARVDGLTVKPLTLTNSIG